MTLPATLSTMALLQALFSNNSIEDVGEMTEDKFAILAIRNGEVRGICGISDDETLREAVAEWALDPTVTAMLRVPVEVARKSFDATEADVRAMLVALSGPKP